MSDLMRDEVPMPYGGLPDGFSAEDWQRARATMRPKDLARLDNECAELAEYLRFRARFERTSAWAQKHGEETPGQTVVWPTLDECISGRDLAETASRLRGRRPVAAQGSGCITLDEYLALPGLVHEDDAAYAKWRMWYTLAAEMIADPRERAAIRLTPVEWAEWIDTGDIAYPKAGLANMSDLLADTPVADQLALAREADEREARLRREERDAIARGEAVPPPYDQEEEERKNLLAIGRKMQALQAVHGDHPGPGCISLERAIALGVIGEDDVPEYAIRKLYVFREGVRFLDDFEALGADAPRPACGWLQDQWWKERDRSRDLLLTPGEWRLWLKCGTTRSWFQFQGEWERVAAQLPVEQVLALVKGVEVTLDAETEAGLIPARAQALEVATDESRITLIAEDSRTVPLDLADMVVDGILIPPEEVAKAELIEAGAVLWIAYASVDLEVQSLWREHRKYELLAELAKKG